MTPRDKIAILFFGLILFSIIFTVFYLFARILCDCDRDFDDHSDLSPDIFDESKKKENL